LLRANFCNRILQAAKFVLKNVVVQRTKESVSSLAKMVNLGYINIYTVLNTKYVDVKLKYNEGESVIRGIFLVSKSSLNIYVKVDDILKMLRDNFFCLSGFLTFFTSKGHALDIECFLHGIGGKVNYGLY